jgi:hypothetical protein
MVKEEAILILGQGIVSPAHYTPIQNDSTCRDYTPALVELVTPGSEHIQ